MMNDGAMEKKCSNHEKKKNSSANAKKRSKTNDVFLTLNFGFFTSLALICKEL